MKNLVYIFFLFVFSIISYGTVAQSLPVGTSVLEDYYRRAQLLGDIDGTSSFANRPLFPFQAIGLSVFDPDSTLARSRKSKFDGKMELFEGKALIQLLPVSILSQFNTHHPEGYNDGSMIPARGFQTQISAGIYLKFGPLSFQLRPEFVSAQNKAFDGFPQDYTSATGVKFPNSPYYNIDYPERFGDNPYNQAFWGQSNIRLTFGAISLGLSNENLWWGPGFKNTLLMTNSAPGFKHLTLNTVKPIKTRIGFFEGQIIAGKLENSGFIENLGNDWRYINAIVLTYNPKWFPGLFLGGSRIFVSSNLDLGNGPGDYLPVFSFLTRSGKTSSEVDDGPLNQLVSIFMRWLFQEAHGEIYFEYGREDNSWGIRDFIQEPAHSSAYILGLRKLYALNRQKETYLQIIAESTHLASPQTTINRNRYNGTFASNWYKHVRSYYTNQGQILGAGIGPGSNLQTLDISWVRSLKQIGFQVERYMHNNDFWYNKVKDIRANWVDINTMVYANWDYKNLLFSIKFKYVKSYNYEWMYEPDYGENEPAFWASSKNTSNFHGQIGLTYRF